MKTHNQLADDLDCIASEVPLSMMRHAALAECAAALRKSGTALAFARDYFEVNGYGPETPVLIKINDALK